jgi:GT2 family glycosyltransferase
MSSRIAAVPSLDASSTTISSRSSTDWRRTLAIAVRRKRSPSFTARRTDTSGAGGVLTGERTIASRLVTEALPTFDLILATVDRAEELNGFLDSLERQTHAGFRLIVVDQNDDDYVEQALAGRPFEVVGLRSERGLSRARNVALPHVTADLVAFPDDDCVYPPDLLERVARRFAAEPTLDGLTGREVDEDGRSAPSWKTDAALLTDDNLWNRAISFSIFLRREAVTAVGGFDEQLGLGSGTPWSSGEEIDYLVRAVRSGARIEYDPGITVTHTAKTLADAERRAVAYRDGASVGYVLRKNRYPSRVVARMLVRPLGGALVSLLKLDGSHVRRRLASWRGRVAGYRRPS